MLRIARHIDYGQFREALPVSLSHLFGAFELDIRPGTLDDPAAVKIILLRYTRGEDRRLLITPDCASF